MIVITSRMFLYGAMLTTFVALGSFFNIERAEAATLSVSPSTGVYTSGGSFTARVVVNTSGVGINAAEGTLSFDPAQLSVVGVSKGSIFSLWTSEPTYSNGAGTISFSGGSPTGYTGSAGTVLSITFKTKGSGTAKVGFKNGSVLAADGRGTNVLTSMSGGTFTIASAEVSPEPEVIEYVAPANTPGLPNVRSTTHPDPKQWYKTKNAELQWDVPSGVISVRTLLDTNSGSIPTKVYETPISSLTLSDLAEGVQYFHIQFKNIDGWGRVAHYRLAVDSQAPTTFALELINPSDNADPTPSFSLSVSDATSAIATYKVIVDSMEPYEFVPESTTTPLTLSAQTPGPHTLIVEAFDLAGNSIVATKSFEISAFEKPVFTDFPVEVHTSVIPVIRGVTRPNSEVQVTVQRGGIEPTIYTVTSDAGGVFTVVPEGKFSVGVYEFVAVATDEHGAQSEPSDIQRMAVQETALVHAGGMLVDLLSIVVPLVGIGVLLFLMFVWMRVRLTKVTKVVRKETKDALKVVDHEFELIANAVSEQRNLLLASHKTKKLTKTEVVLFEDIIKSLKQAQLRIHDEVAEVDDIVE